MTTTVSETAAEREPETNPVIATAVAALQAFGDLDRKQAEQMLPLWRHGSELTGRERAAVLAAFPDPRRKAMAAGLRELADLIETTELPVGYGFDLRHYVSSDAAFKDAPHEEVLAELTRIAGILGVDPSLQETPYSHPNARKRFAEGVVYEAIYIPKRKADASDGAA